MSILVSSSNPIILMGKRELVALLVLYSWCLVIVVWLFLGVPWVCLRFVIAVFRDHTHLLYMYFILCISEFRAVFNINVKLRFLDLQYISYSNDFKSFSCSIPGYPYFTDCMMCSSTNLRYFQ